MPSNNINAEKQVEDIVKAWSKLEKTVSDNVAILEKYAKISASLPSEYLKQVEETRKAQEGLNKALEEAKSTQKTYTDLKKEEERQVKKLAKVKIQLAKANSKENKEYHKLNEAKKAAEKLNREEARRLVATQGLYSKVQSGINQVTKKYQDLATRKELNGKLSAEEIIELGKLEAKLNKYQNVLKKVDANIGKHQRNVGNYKSGFDGLGFSVAQLSREMPAFANSMQTGFMAISNNIPMLVDEINKLKIANKDLAASGKPTVSILKSLGKAMFSWHTLISVGVTLLTVYGAKVFDTIFAISEEEKALKKTNKEIKEQNKALKENIDLRKRQLQGVRDFINNKEALSEFQKVLNDLTKDSGDAEAVLKELADRMGKMGLDGVDALTNQNILTSDRLVIAANLLEIEEQNIKLQEERTRLDEVARKKKEILSDTSIGSATKELRLSKLGSESLSKTITIQKEINRLKEANNSIIGKTVELENNVTDEKRKQQNLDTVQYSSGSQKAIDAQIAKLTELRDAAEIGSVKWATYDYTLQLLITTNKALNGELKTNKDEIGELTKELTKATDKYKDFLKGVQNLQEQLKQELGDLKGSFAQDLFSDAGFDFAGQMLMNFDRVSAMLEEGGDKWQDYFGIITEVGQEAFNFLSQNRDAHFQAEYDRLEQEKATALQFAGESDAAKQRIEEQAEARRRVIQRRQAKAQKESAIANTVINTAQAIVATLGKTGFAGIPLAAIVGAIGAAQLAIITSQKIPEFRDGVRNFGGGMAIVGDGGVSEVVTTPDGGVFKTPNTDTLVNLPKGSNVYKSETDFEKELGNLLDINNIFPFKESVVKDTPIINMSNGVTAAEMNTIMEKNLSKISVNNVSLNKKGISSWMQQGNSATYFENNRVEFKGLDV